MTEEERLILHVKGTENQTAELPTQIVRAGIAQGQITRSQLIWSVPHNAWKQVRELPHLLPSQKLAPAPTLPVAEISEPAPTPDVQQTGPVPRVAVKAGGATPVVKAAAAPAVQVSAATKSAEHYVVHDHTGSHPLKWFCIILAVLIAVIIGINYLLVDQPLTNKMTLTRYDKVPVYAHLGAFVQPGALIIHVPVSATVDKKDFLSFLVTVAHNTPGTPLGKPLFDYVSLTTGWTAHYTMSGYAWKEFGDMDGEDEATKEAFLLDQLRDSSGQTLVTPKGVLEASAQQAEREKVLEEFLSYFGK